MATHARFGRRHAGELAGVGGGVAIAAIDAEAADVMLVGKRDRLLNGDVLLIDVRRPLPGVSRADEDQHHQRHRHGRAAGEGVGGGVEGARHG